MANLQALQAELEATDKAIQEARKAQIDALIAAKAAEEESKTPADYEAELQAQLDAKKALLAGLQA